MTQFESRQQDIAAAHSQLVFIAAEKRDGIWKPAKFLANNPIASAFLLDEDRTVTKSYGLHNALAVDAMNIAHPATLVIDREAVVRYIYRGDNQLDRAPLDEVIRVSEEIGK